VNERSAWVRLWFVWLLPALLLTANAVWLLGLRAAVLGRGSLLAKQRDAVAGEVAALAAQRETLSGAQQSLTRLEQDLGAMRKERLGSMRERLVSFLVDITKRTHAAGLRPERINYTADTDVKTGMVHFSAIFNLSGTYEEVRRCVNLLESSPQFVVVERLTVRSEDSANSLAVGVQLSVGTYFVDADTGMLRQLGIEDLPKVAAAAPASPTTSGAAVEEVATEEPRTDFASVDAQVMEDLRTAVAGLSSEAKAADEDLFVAPEPEPGPRSRRDRGRVLGDRRARTDSFATQVGRREVSGGR
jgi:hypothetical protein